MDHQMKIAILILNELIWQRRPFHNIPYASSNCVYSPNELPHYFILACLNEDLYSEQESVFLWLYMKYVTFLPDND